MRRLSLVDCSAIPPVRQSQFPWVWVYPIVQSHSRLKASWSRSCRRGHRCTLLIDKVTMVHFEHPQEENAPSAIAWSDTSAILMRKSILQKIRARIARQTPINDQYFKLHSRHSTHVLVIQQSLLWHPAILFFSGWICNTRSTSQMGSIRSSLPALYPLWRWLSSPSSSLPLRILFRTGRRFSQSFHTPSLSPKTPDLSDTEAMGSTPPHT